MEDLENVPLKKADSVQEELKRGNDVPPVKLTTPMRFMEQVKKIEKVFLEKVDY